MAGKKQLVKKWLRPHKIDDICTWQFAERRTEEIWEIMQKEETSEDYEFWKQHGVIGGWKHKNKEGILRGFRGEDWARAMFEDFSSSPYQPSIKEKVPYDIYIPNLGTVDVKTSKFGDNYIKIKRTFFKRPSLYVVGLKTCEKAMETFQFVGWLYGTEIYHLELNKDMPFEPCMTPLFEELHSPESFFQKLLKISK